MHHRAPDPARTRRQARRRKGLLGLTAALAMAGGGGLVLPHVLGSATGPASPATVNVHDAAQQQPVQASQAPATAATPASGGTVSGGGGISSTAAASASTAAGMAAATTSAPQAVAPAPGAAAAIDGKEHRADQRKNRPPAPAAPNPSCTLAVPTAPTTAAGLATPYRLTATDPGAGACHETNPDQSAFVEAAVYNPAAHTVSIYHPVVVDGQDSPAATPVPVTLPAGAVVGIWFGYNGDTLTLGGPGAASCVNGLPGSPFGQFAYCNAPAFFAAVNGDKQVTVPPLGTGRDGRPCPTTRDFSVVDQDQSDNLATVYRVVNGRIAQDTAATRGGTALTNGSDEGLLAKAIDPALGCAAPTAPDLTNGGAPTPSLALNELSAARYQQAPAALVPLSDPMVQVNGRSSQSKTDLYRAGVNQPSLATNPGQSPTAYCTAIGSMAPPRLTADLALLRAGTSPSTDFPNLLAFMVDRLQGSLQNLSCAPDGQVTAAVQKLVIAAKGR
jgi:hypothetical protein